MSGRYDDIINLPHHVSKVHPQMSMYQRAAQFAPFAALTGHSAAIDETTKQNAERYEIADDDTMDQELDPLDSQPLTPRNE